MLGGAAAGGCSALSSPSVRSLGVDEGWASIFVGQVVGAMNTVKPARRVVLEMVEEFIDAVERLDTLVLTE